MQEDSISLSRRGEEEGGKEARIPTLKVWLNVELWLETWVATGRGADGEGVWRQLDL